MFMFAGFCFLSSLGNCDILLVLFLPLRNVKNHICPVNLYFVVKKCKYAWLILLLFVWSQQSFMPLVCCDDVDGIVVISLYDWNLHRLCPDTDTYSPVARKLALFPLSDLYLMDVMVVAVVRQLTEQCPK